MSKPRPLIEGVCRRCGCTDRYGCILGCAWADEGHTLCDRCAAPGVVVLTIPGDAQAQKTSGRKVIVPKGGARPFVQTYQHPKSASWRALIQAHAKAAGVEMTTAPLFLEVLAVYSLPKSRWKKREPVERDVKASKPDTDNITKAVKDSMKGVLYPDDAIVVGDLVLKLCGDQGEGAYTMIRFTPFSSMVFSPNQQEVSLGF